MPIQWGFEHQTLEYRTHQNTEHFEVWISNCLVLEWLVIAIAIVMAVAIVMVLNVLKLNHWKSKQNGVHFV